MAAKTPHLDFSAVGVPQTLNASFAKLLRARFLESSDAITLASLTRRGADVLLQPKKQNTPSKYYRLNNGRWTYHRTKGARGRAVDAPAIGLMFAPLYKDILAADAAILGALPDGTEIRIKELHDDVPTQRAQISGLLHVDVPGTQIDNPPCHAAYDVIDDSDLPIRYLLDYQGEADDVQDILRENSGLYRLDKQEAREPRSDPNYIGWLAGNRRRIWAPKPMSVVMRRVATPHMGTPNVSSHPVARRYARLIVARP